MMLSKLRLEARDGIAITVDILIPTHCLNVSHVARIKNRLTVSQHICSKHDYFHTISFNIFLQPENNTLAGTKRKVPEIIKVIKENIIMASNKQNKSALNSIKMQAASEVGVALNNGYNGDLTSKQAGSIGGQMVKDMINSYKQNNGGNMSSNG